MSKKRFNVDNISDMKGIGFGGHQVSTKNRFHAENSKVFAERHPFQGHFALKELASH